MTQEPPGRQTDDVARIYLGIVAASAGYDPAVVRAALSMSVVLLGEQHGLSGPELFEWIEAISATARLAAEFAPADRVRTN